MNPLAEILGSKIRAEILRLLFAGPDAALHVREIERRTGFNDRAIRQELARLTRLDLLHARRDGNRLYYGAHTEHPLYPDLRNLALKTCGIVAKLSVALDVPGVQAAFVFGSFAKGEATAQSDIDVMVIGSAGLREVSHLLSGLNEAAGRAVNPYVMSAVEFRKRVAGKDHFLTNVLAEPKILLKGTVDEPDRVGA